jgi:hypothetical protein
MRPDKVPSGTLFDDKLSDRESVTACSARSQYRWPPPRTRAGHLVSFCGWDKCARTAALGLPLEPA